MTVSIVHSVPALDELVGDEGSVLLVGDETTGHRVLRVTALGQEIREQAKHGIAFPHLVDELITVFGPPSEDPAEATRLVKQAVEALVAQGALTLRATY